MASLEALICVEVAYALPGQQRLLTLQVEQGCTALQAVQRSGIAELFPGLDPATTDMGVFSTNLDGKALPLPADYVVKPGDRIELYRPLVADPKVVRQQRAARARKQRQS